MHNSFLEPSLILMPKMMPKVLFLRVQMSNQNSKFSSAFSRVHSTSHFNFLFLFFPLFLSHTGPSAFDLVAQLGPAQGVISFLKPLQAAVSVKLWRVLPRCALPTSA
jgi:hypothetical protein